MKSYKIKLPSANEANDFDEFVYLFCLSIPIRAFMLAATHAVAVSQKHPSSPLITTTASSRGADREHRKQSRIQQSTRNTRFAEHHWQANSCVVPN
jgi:hypothetical protein